MHRETIFSGMIKGGHVGMRGPKKVTEEMDDGLFHVMQIRTDSEIVWNFFIFIFSHFLEKSA